jgi:hypothetical protein
MAPAVATYEPRDPSSTVLYKVVAEHLETFLTSLDTDPDAKGLPAYVHRIGKCIFPILEAPVNQG